jgi:hypothetical protein
MISAASAGGLALSESADEKMVAFRSASWKHIVAWLRGVDSLRKAAV